MPAQKTRLLSSAQQDCTSTCAHTFANTADLSQAAVQFWLQGQFRRAAETAASSAFAGTFAARRCMQTAAPCATPKPWWASVGVILAQAAPQPRYCTD